MAPLRSVRPAHLGLVVAGGLLVVANLGPITDPDAYWHIPMGQQILSGHTLHPAGTQWLAVPTGQWSTTQWAAEAAMAQLVDLGGWQALAAARAVLFTAILGVLAVTLLHGRTTAHALGVWAVTGLGLVPYVQDRPQTVSLLFVVPLGWLCVRAWTSGQAPPVVPVALGCLVWAQFHGLWVLAPGAFLLTGLGLAVDSRRPALRHRTLPVTGCLLAALAAFSGLVNPVGLGSLTAPWRFTGASQVLGEWRPTTLTQPHAIGCAVLIVLVATGWWGVAGRPGAVIPVTEVVWVACWSLFAALAYRNCLPALLCLAPAAATALDRAWGERARARERPNSRRVTQNLRVLLAACVIGSVLAVTLAVARVDPLAQATVRPLAQRLAREPAPVRVFDAYDASGQLVAFGGGNVRLIVDGRFDLWGAAYVQRVIRAAQLGAGWEKTVGDFRPDAFVLPADAPLTTLLLREGHWRLALGNAGWSLLLPAGTR